MPRSAKKRKRWWIMIRWRASLRGGVFSPNKKTWIGALGLEPTFELYIEHLCGIYDEVFRVLRSDGCCFVNLGDTYSCSPAGNKTPCGLQQKTEIERKAKMTKVQRFDKKNYGGLSDSQKTTHQGRGIGASVQQKSLCLIPQRFAIKMVEHGWILRNVLIWHKPNPMPSSAKDRFTVDFEYVYFFVKQQRYFFEPQYEPHTRDWAGCGGNLAGKGTHKLNNGFSDIGDRTDLTPNPLGRNKRTVWTIPTQSFADAHFATFPEKLVEPMILSGCPKEVCSRCGQGRKKVYDVSYVVHKEDADPKKITEDGLAANNYGSMKYAKASAQHHFKGYTDCGCKDREWRPGIVLDMFRGQLHRRQGRRAA